MVVKLKRTGKTVEVNASYGTRLIAQGQASAVPQPSVPQPKPKKGAPRKEAGGKAPAEPKAAITDDAAENNGGDG